MDPRNVFSDNIYRTLEVGNFTDTVASINFDANLGVTIVPNPRMYYLLVSKFILPNKALPIFFFDNTTHEYWITVNGIKSFITMESVDYRGNAYGLSNESTVYGGVYYIRQFLQKSSYFSLHFE